MNTEPQNPMNEFEHQLRRSIRRVNAPETMAKFILAAAEVKAERTRPRAQRKHRWAFAFPSLPSLAMARGGWAMAATVLLVTGALGGARIHQQHEQAARSALATQQFDTANRITEQTLEHTREQLRRAGVSLDQ